ncbi:unnamed protein product [Vitrella brassicaformis CCMP3155]|uniref:Dolichyl-diphosphooligosaccharide-protein glycosyltransferase subunit OST5 n=1 Tax=Vitrella brassicaformis (strain CCMP3155) TaxID=1169540 RepID=A0A0G4EJP2_VITBC|nr:unnamed protein product [Vitrella brassicaformis CCMP3155]|eukprot:CEL96977.1 unnamed protein product [Vitrella brassicaformis CCMP3155]
MVSEIKPFSPLVHISQFGNLAWTLLLVGALLAAWFFIYEVTTGKFERSLLKELVIALLSSVFLGIGGMFLLLSIGLYF